MASKSKTAFVDGLPPDASKGLYLGFDKGDRPYLLAWRDDLGAWAASGFDAFLAESGVTRSTSFAIAGEYADVIVRHQAGALS